MEKRQRKLCFLVLGIPFVWALSNSMLMPVLPTVQQQANISKVQASLLITVLSIPAGLVLPFAGMLSDRYGRLAVLVPGTIVYGLGGLLAGLAGAFLERPYHALVGARLLQGVGAAGTNLLAMSLIGDISRGRERLRLLGLVEISNSLGKLVSPLVGSGVALLVWYAPFFVYPALAIPLALAIWCTGRGIVPGPTKQPFSGYYGALARAIQQRGASLVLLLLAGFAAIFLWFGNLLYLAQVLDSVFNVGGLLRGMLLSLPVVAMAVSAFVTSRYLTFIPLVRLVTGGLGLVSLVLAAEAFLPAAFDVYAAPALIGIGLGAVLPSLNTLITRALPTAQRGILTTTYGSIRSFGSALGPLVFGATMDLGRLPLFLAAAALAATAGGLVLRSTTAEKP